MSLPADFDEDLLSRGSVNDINKVEDKEELKSTIKNELDGMMKKSGGGNNNNNDFKPNDSSISELSSMSLDDIGDNKETLQTKINQELEGMMSDISSSDDLSDFDSDEDDDDSDGISDLSSSVEED